MFIDSRLHGNDLLEEAHNIESIFNRATDYAAFSVSESKLDKVIKYILNQEEHHKNKSFTEEYEEFLRVYNVKVE